MTQSAPADALGIAKEPRRPRIRIWPAGGSLADVAAATVLLTLALAVRPPDLQLARSLEPRPDALEYCISALRLAAGQGYSLPLGAGAYPPRYEPGFPLLLAAWFRLTGPAVEHAATLLQILSAAGILLFAFGCRHTFGRPASLLASALLVLCGLQIECGRPLMCETLLFALGCGLLACLNRADRPNAGRSLLSGLVAAALGTVRLTHWLGAAALLLWLAFAERRRKLVLAYLLGMALVAAPWLAFRGLRFGAPWNSGYSYWLPEIHGASKTFSLGHLLRVQDGPGSLKSYLKWTLDPEIGAWPLAGLLLATIGTTATFLRRAQRWETLLPVFIVLGVPMLPLFFYFWLEPRFLVPLLPLAALATAAGFELLLAAPRRSVRALGWVLAAAALLQSASFIANHRGTDWISPRVADLDGLKATKSRLRPGDVLVTDVPLVLTSWELPGTLSLALVQWEDEHLSRIKRRGLEPLGGGPAAAGLAAELFPATALFVDALRPHSSAMSVFQTAWERGRRVFVLLSLHSTDVRLLKDEIWPMSVRRVGRGEGWVLLRLEPAAGPG